MLNFIKYEIKGSMKIIAIIFVIMLLLNSYFLYSLGEWSSIKTYSLTFLLGLSGGFAILLYSISSFNKEVYNDRGYLTLTLPISGNEIVISKLITTIIWYLIYLTIEIIFAYFFLDKQSDIINNREATQFFQILKSLFNAKILSLIIFGAIIQLSVFMMTVYFSIGLSKAGFKANKFNKLLSFVVFLIINGTIGYLTVLIEKLLPYRVSFNMKENFMNLNLVNNDIVSRGLSLNIASTFFSILLFITFLMTTGYFLDKKIDL